MNKPLASAKKFVSTHKTAIAFTAGVVVATTAAYALSRSAVNQWNGFLENKGLFDEFYSGE